MAEPKTRPHREHPWEWDWMRNRTLRRLYLIVTLPVYFVATSVEVLQEELWPFFKDDIAKVWRPHEEDTN